MRVEVLFFAAARERSGASRESVELAESATVTVADLCRLLGERHPGLVVLLPRLRFAVNQTFVALDHELAEGDEVALIPPVAGGSGRCAMSDRPLELDAVIRLVAGPERGAVVSFSGTVRQSSQGKNVRYLEYEAYEPMALARLEAIAAEAEERCPGALVAIHHRTGVLQVGEAAVAIAAAAPHRAEAFRACEYALERLKEDVPIWKKEVFEDGAQWVGLSRD